jgi:hypothetical protein
MTEGVEEQQQQQQQQQQGRWKACTAAAGGSSRLEGSLLLEGQPRIAEGVEGQQQQQQLDQAKMLQATIAGRVSTSASAIWLTHGPVCTVCERIGVTTAAASHGRVTRDTLHYCSSDWGLLSPPLLLRRWW